MPPGIYETITLIDLSVYGDRPWLLCSSSSLTWPLLSPFRDPASAPFNDGIFLLTPHGIQNELCALTGIIRVRPWSWLLRLPGRSFDSNPGSLITWPAVTRRCRPCYLKGILELFHIVLNLAMEPGSWNPSSNFTPGSRETF